MYFHNTCTRNSDYLILFIKTGDAQKIRIMSHTIFNTFTEIKLFSNKPIFRFGAGHFVFIFVVLSSLTALFALSLA